jgi:hypothetical protein
VRERTSIGTVCFATPTNRLALTNLQTFEETVTDQQITVRIIAVKRKNREISPVAKTLKANHISANAH